MRLLDADNLAAYLQETGRVAPGERISVQRLSGGVSNEAFYVARDGGEDFVFKQARQQLRTPEPWFCGVERIWREVEVLRVCEELLCGQSQRSPLTGRTVRTPRILFEDRENYAFAMTAAPRDHAVWKQQLLAGKIDPSIATECGRLLAALHAGSWNRPEVAARLSDRQVFDELRLDPYYRFVAQQQPSAAGPLRELIDSVWQHRLSLVHADFSPKNLLVFDGGLMMVDFETGHFGDPAFDLGFFLSHLVLKAVYRAPGHEPYLDLTERFWAAYTAGIDPSAGDAYPPLVVRAIRNFAGCLWARIDGKSKVEYLVDSPRRELVRRFAEQLLADPPTGWAQVLPAAAALCGECCRKNDPNE